MKGFNLKVFKKGNPTFWIIGAIALFVFFYLYSSRGATKSASTGGGVVSYNQGPSDAQVSAAAGISAMQLQANAANFAAQLDYAKTQDQNDAAVAIANLESQLGLVAVNKEAEIQLTGINAGRDVDLAALDNQKQIAYLQTEYAIEGARIASEETITLRNIDRNMFADQLNNNREMLKIQADTMTNQALIGQVGSLKKKDRDDTLKFIAGQVSPGDNKVPYNYSNNTFLGL